MTDAKLLSPVILVNSSSEYNIASFCTFLDTATSFNAVFCEFGFKGLGNLSKENFLSERNQETIPVIEGHIFTSRVATYYVQLQLSMVSRMAVLRKKKYFFLASVDRWQNSPAGGQSQFFVIN